MGHFAKAHWQDVVPQYDALELHVKRMRWVLRYWLSAYQGRDQCPIAVPGVPRAGEHRGEKEGNDARKYAGCLRQVRPLGCAESRSSPDKFLPYRNLGRCPIRATSTLCTQTACAFRRCSNAKRRKDLDRSAQREQPLSEKVWVDQLA